MNIKDWIDQEIKKFSDYDRHLLVLIVLQAIGCLALLTCVLIWVLTSL